MRSVWLQSFFGGEDGMLPLCSLSKPSALSDRRHQPLIIGSAGTPALRRHAAAGKTRRCRRPMRRRPRTEGLMGRPRSAGLARWSAEWARLAARVASMAAVQKRHSRGHRRKSDNF